MLVGNWKTNRWWRTYRLRFGRRRGLARRLVPLVRSRRRAPRPAMRRASRARSRMGRRRTGGERPAAGSHASDGDGVLVHTRPEVNRNPPVIRLTEGRPQPRPTPEMAMPAVMIRADGRTPARARRRPKGGAALLRRRPKGLLPAARQELLDPSKAWWGGRRGRLADWPPYSISVSLGVVPRWYSRVVEVPVRIEVAAGFVAPGASEPPRLQPSWPPGGSRPAHG